MISVVFPVYNSAKFLHSSLPSIINQSFSNIEILIIYDESSDDTLSIIKDYQLMDSRIKIIYGQNAGLIGALNLGLSHASGKFIARMDADDLSFPQRFELQHKFINSGSYDICGCHFNIIDDNDNLIRVHKVPLFHEQISIELCRRVPFAHGSVLIRKSFLDYYNLSYGSPFFSSCEDFDLWVRMYNLGAIFGNVDDILFNYRDQPNSISKSKLNELYVSNTLLANNFLYSNKSIVLKNIKKYNGYKLSDDLNKTFCFVLFKLLFINKFSFYIFKNFNYRFIIWAFLKFFFDCVRLYKIKFFKI